MIRTSHPDFSFFVKFLFEYGLLLNDDLNFKMALLASGLNDKGLNSLMQDISSTINPGAGSVKSEIDSKIPNLMKELENTIVVIDKESMRRAQAESRQEKLKL